MNNQHYTRDKSQQILISLLKKYGINKVIASPGSSNMTLVFSFQHDPFFKMYSCVDERSAAYMACGMAAETGEPVVLTCTEATSSRNYLPALTEAYYRKLPVIAIMTSHGETTIGSYEPQVIDNSVTPVDTSVYNYKISAFYTEEQRRSLILHINEGLNRLRFNGGGPIRFVLEIHHEPNYDVKSLPDCPIIKQYLYGDNLPQLPNGKIAIFIGSHQTFSEATTKAIERFCELNNAAVICDLTSNYNGKYRISYSLIGSQEGYKSFAPAIDLVIYIGSITGDYYGVNLCRSTKNFWLVNQDGAFRDRYQNLSAVFTMNECDFFKYYGNCKNKEDLSFYNELKTQYDSMVKQIPELPFSNIWMAQVSSGILPPNSVLHVAINNSLRAWNFADIPNGITGFCNVGGYGIDGGTSSFIGASLAHPQKLFFLICGDLSFFYDINVIGNRHVGNNVRILLVNNGHGQEFRFYQSPASQFGDDTDKYVAAGGHNGAKSSTLVKHIANDLGYEYITASNKQEFLANYKRFFDESSKATPIIFEVFTDNEDENTSLKKLRTILPYSPSVKDIIKDKTKKLLGERGTDILRAAKGH